MFLLNTKIMSLGGTQYAKEAHELHCTQTKGSFMFKKNITGKSSSTGTRKNTYASQNMCIGLSQWYNNNVIEQFHQLIYRIKNFRSRWGLSTLKLIKAVEKEKKNSTNSLTIAWKHHWLKLLPSNRCIKRTYSVYIENLVHYDVQKRKEGENLT